MIAVAPTLFGCNFAQPALPGFAKLVYPTPRRSALGWMGEVTVSQQLQAAGYHVQPGRAGEGDLRAIDTRTGQILRIEVKTALQSIDRKWRFLLWKPGHTDYRHSDVVILLAVLDDYHYVAFAIPRADLGQRSQLCISSNPATYKGWLASYRINPAADLLSPPSALVPPLYCMERGLGGEVLATPGAGGGVSEAPLSEVPSC